jgi:hypothetical protein
MRRFLFFAALLALVASGFGGATARAVEPGDEIDPRLAAYPEITIRITDQAIEAPAVAPAGRTLIIQENQSEEDAHFFILRFPEDLTPERIHADLEADSDALPEWFARSAFVGNPDRAAPAGGRVFGVVDLVPGRYLVMDPLEPRTPARFTVADTPAAPRQEPEADVAVTMFEMGFTLPGSVHAGRQVWRVDNTGAAFHELAVMPVPAGASADHTIAALSALFAEQPVPTELGIAWAGWSFSLVNGVGVTSPGGAVWAQFDLAPGTYAVLCFVPGGNDLPHLMEGMVKIFTVANGGELGAAA